MSILRTYNVQNPDSASVNVELSAAGGGGQERELGPALQAGRGGSGIVIIAYPS